MSRIRACLTTYIAAWWMKLLVAAIAVAAILAICFAESTRESVPAWPRPTFVDWSDVPSLVDAEVRERVSQSRNVVAIEDVEALTLPANGIVKLDPTRAQNLRHVRIEASHDLYLGFGLLPSGDPHPQYESRKESITTDVRELLLAVSQVPTVESVELHGMFRTSALEPLRGQSHIQNLYTGELQIDGGREVASAEVSGLVETVRQMPSLEVWGVPSAWYLFDESASAELADHHSLRTLLCDNTSGTAQSFLQTRFPGLAVQSGYVQLGRFRFAIIAFAIAVGVSTCVMLNLADMLLLSNASIIPNYATTHRRVAFGLMIAVTVVTAACLVRADVSVTSALIWAAFSAFLSGAALYFDARRPVPGLLITPACFAPLIAFALSAFAATNADRVLWFDEFLQANFSWTASAIALLGFACVTLFWRTSGSYAKQLSGLGRSSAFAPVGTDLERIWGGAWTGSESQQRVPTPPAVASRALQAGHLSSPATAAGRRDLLSEGMVRIPTKQILIGVVVFSVMFPFLTQLSAPGKFDPDILLRIVPIILLCALWGRPLIQWNERIRRIPLEIGSLLPREQYLAAVKDLLQRAFIVPSALTAVALSLALVLKNGSWAGVPIAVGLAFLMAISAASLIQLSLTYESQLVRFLTCFGLGYVVLGSVGASIVALMQKAPGSAVFGLNAWGAIPIVIAAALAALLYWGAARRITSYEFGRQL